MNDGRHTNSILYVSFIFFVCYYGACKTLKNSKTLPRKCRICTIFKEWTFDRFKCLVLSLLFIFLHLCTCTLEPWNITKDNYCQILKNTQNLVKNPLKTFSRIVFSLKLFSPSCDQVHKIGNSLKQVESSHCSNWSLNIDMQQTNKYYQISSVFHQY